MLHFSTDRLAGLDTMILKITTTPPKVPTLISNHSLQHDTYRIPVRRLKKQKRSPLADKTHSTNLPPRPHHPMLLHSLSTTGDVDLLPPSSPCVPGSPELPIFRPLPPLPSASSLQLPSFLNLSTRSFAPVVDPPPRPTTSLPASVLLRVSSPAASSRPTVVRKTRNNKVFEGPQWIPAFHHPNSPYVPWSSPVRRRILPPPSPLPSPLCPSPCIRSGAVAPEPGASSMFSRAQDGPAKERLLSSWKSFKNSVKKGVKTVVSRLGKSKVAMRMLCTNQDMLSMYDGTDTITVVPPNSTPNAVRSTLAMTCSCDPLASSVSSDSTTLAAWLAERHTDASSVVDDTPREMTMEEYELVGSWLDLRHSDGGWVCGVQDCDMHAVDGSPYAVNDYPDGLRMAMPFDSAELSTVIRPTPRTHAFPFPDVVPPRFHSLPRLPCQSFDMRSAREAKPVAVTRRELSMPGGWTFS